MSCQQRCRWYADGIQLRVCVSECRQCSLPDVPVSGQNRDSDTKQMVLSQDGAELMQADRGTGQEGTAELCRWMPSYARCYLRFTASRGVKEGAVPLS